MEKKSIIIFCIWIILVFVWLMLVGQASGVSGIAGNINLIDEGQFAAWINGIMHRKLIYRDIYIQYGPLQLLLPYFLIKYFGQSFFLIRLSEVISTVLGISIAYVLLLYLKVKPLIRRLAIFFIILVPSINIRHWLGILTILLVLKAYEKKSVRLSFISGVFLLLALVESVEVGLFSIIIASAYIAIRFIKEKEIGREIRSALLLFFGFTLTLCIFILIAINGGWFTSYLKATLDISNSVAGVNLPNGTGLPQFTLSDKYLPIFIPLILLLSKPSLFYISLTLLLVFLSIEVVRFVLGLTDKQDTFIVMTIAFTLLIYISTIGRSGHYPTIFPMVLLISAYFVSLIYETNIRKGKGKKLIKVVFILLFAIYALRHLSIYRYNIFSNLLGVFINSSVFRVAPIAVSAEQAADIVSLQDFFTKHSNYSDSVYFLNNNPGYYFLINRVNPTRYDLPLLAGTKEKRFEIVSELSTDPPLYAVLDTKAWAVDRISDEQRMPEVFHYIKSNYHIVEVIRGFILYKKGKQLAR